MPKWEDCPAPLGSSGSVFLPHHALPGALLPPGHGAAGADPGCGLLTQGAVLQAPIPQASALANLLSRGAEPGLMLILHLGDVESLHNPA